MKTLGTYKVEKTTKKTKKVPMPKYKLGHEVITYWYLGLDKKYSYSNVVSADWFVDDEVWKYKMSDGRIMDEKTLGKYNLI